MSKVLNWDAEVVELEPREAEQEVLRSLGERLPARIGVPSVAVRRFEAPAQLVDRLQLQRERVERRLPRLCPELGLVCHRISLQSVRSTTKSVSCRRNSSWTDGGIQARSAARRALASPAQWRATLRA